MSHPEVVETLRANATRIVSDGIPYSDLLFLEKDIADASQWCERWVALSRTYERLADEALDRGAAMTAGELLWRAALCCHFGQGIRMDVDPQAKRSADQRKNALFLRAAPLLRPPMERVDIPYEADVLPGYLRLPLQRPAGGKLPCVVVFGGLDTTKEDALEVSNHLVARGLAVLTFDGPGQGEMFHRMPLRVDFETAVSAAIDYACSRPEIDAGRIAVLGRSTGGHWACKTAATDPRVKAAIAWGLIYHLRGFGAFSPSLQKRFMRAAGAGTEQQAADFFAPFDLETAASRIRCPVLVVQGSEDPIAPPDSAERLKASAGGPVEVVMYAGSGHCAHDKTHLSKPLMADFAARHLGLAASLAAPPSH